MTTRPEEIPSATIRSADTPPRVRLPYNNERAAQKLLEYADELKRKNTRRTTAKDKDGQGIGIYANMRRNQTPLPHDVKIEAHFKGNPADLAHHTWPTADIAGFIVWRLTKVTGPGKNDRAPLDSTGYIGDGRRAGFDRALEGLAKLRPDWAKPTGVVMPRRMATSDSTIEKFTRTHERLRDEAKRIDAMFDALKADVHTLRAQEADELEAVRRKYADKITAVTRTAQEARAHNTEQLRHVRWALAELGAAIDE